jgi:phosphotransferase system enzyme I (PtsI)
MEIRQGIGVSPGYAVEGAFVLDTERFFIPKRAINACDVKEEIKRFKDAVISARREIIDVRKKFSKLVEGDTTQIFDAHMWMIEDKKIQGEVLRRIREDKVTAEYAVSRVFRRYRKLFNEMKEGYLQERASDVLDNETRLLRHLLGRKRKTLDTIDRKVIIVAHDLTPSQTALLNPRYVVGIACDSGGPTSHTAILAKAMKIPCVVGLKDISTNVSGGDLMALDGSGGAVIVSPDEVTQKSFIQKVDRYHAFEKQLASETENLKTITLDGRAIELMLNIEGPQELEVKSARGYAVGLFRTEFLLMNNSSDLDEKAHYDVYVRCLKNLDGRALIIRTLDLGGEKIPFFNPDIADEHNPILGCRSIRLSFEQPAMFRTQLRSCLRAAVHGPLKIMFPLISSIEEIRRARQFLADVMEEMREEDISFDENVEVGMMIEVPSAALMIDHFVGEVDFFSIGSNDLVQYCLAVDRTNQRVAGLYRPCHPAMLRLIKNVIDVCRKHNKPVSLCGEMAGDLRYTELLLGLGLERFSMLPASIPEIKKMICSIDVGKAETFAREILQMDDSTRIFQLLESRARQIVPIAF